MGSNVIRFEFKGQIWNPLFILHTYSLILGSNLIWYSYLDFFTSHEFTKFSNRTCGLFFRNRYFWGQIWNQRPKRHNNVWWGDRFAEKKMVVTISGVATDFWVGVGGMIWKIAFPKNSAFLWLSATCFWKHTDYGENLSFRRRAIFSISLLF